MKTKTINKSITTTCKSSSSSHLENLDYDLVADLKKTRANISLFELSKLPQQEENILKVLE